MVEEDLRVTITHNIVISPLQQQGEITLLVRRMNNRSVVLHPRQMEFTQVHMDLQQQDGASREVEEGGSFLDSVEEGVLRLGSKEAGALTTKGEGSVVEREDGGRLCRHRNVLYLVTGCFGCCILFSSLTLFRSMLHPISMRLSSFALVSPTSFVNSGKSDHIEVVNRSRLLQIET
jgi:hypothetical protein